MPQAVIRLLGGGGSRGEAGREQGKGQKQANAVVTHESILRCRVMLRRLIQAQCDETLMQRSIKESSCELKHIMVNLVPHPERKNRSGILIRIPFLTLMDV
jgi:hypothetical protein